MKSTRYLEARIGIEPTNKGFADPDLSTISPSESTDLSPKSESGPVPVRWSVATHLARCGWTASDIADVLGVSERLVADLIPGHGSRGSRSVLTKPTPDSAPRKQPPAESILADRYYLRPGPSIRLPSNDEMPVHGVVRQLRRDGKRANEIVWKPKL